MDGERSVDNHQSEPGKDPAAELTGFSPRIHRIFPSEKKPVVWAAEERRSLLPFPLTKSRRRTSRFGQRNHPQWRQRDNPSPAAPGAVGRRKLLRWAAGPGRHAPPHAGTCSSRDHAVPWLNMDCVALKHRLEPESRQRPRLQDGVHKVLLARDCLEVRPGATASGQAEARPVHRAERRRSRGQRAHA